MNRRFFQQLAQLPGARQGQRLPQALQAPLLAVDQRTLPDLLKVLKRYAENIKFYNLSNRLDGHWATLFERSPALVLAQMSAINTQAKREHFLQQQQRGLNFAVRQWQALLSEYEQWFVQADAFAQFTAGDVLFHAQRYAREHLTEHLVNAFAFCQQLLGNRSIPWPRLQQLAGTTKPYERDFQQLSRRELNHFLLTSYEAILHALSLLAQDAKSAFAALLQEPVHDPASGLLLAFVKVFQQTQHITNQFSERLLDFYYQDILQNSPEAAVADRVLLDCLLKPGERLVDIPEGALFTAGQTKNQQDIQYRTTKRSLLTGAELTGLYTFYLQRHQHISPENISQSVTRIKAYDCLQQAFSPPLNVFGYETGARQKTVDLGNQIALCIASDTLLLKEGRRKINLQFGFHDNALLRMDSLKSRFSLLLKELEQPPNNSEAVDEATKTAALLESVPLSQWHEAISQSALSSIKTAFALSLIQALPTGLMHAGDTVPALLAFTKQLTDNLLSDWLSGGEGKSAALLKQALLSLHRQTENLTTLGLVHFQLLYRYLFFNDVFSADDREKIIASLHTKSAVTEQQRLNIAAMQQDFSQSQYATLVHYFQHAFEFHLSETNGWGVHRSYSLGVTAANSKVRQGGFSLTLQLNPDDPAVVPYQPDIHGTTHSAGRPVLMLKVNRFAPCYPLSWFSELTVVKAKVRVDVAGFKDITAHNEYGPVNPNKPFFPFGAMPKNDTQLYIGGYEFARKRVMQLTMTLHWQDLPKNFGGFDRYYESYGPGYTNRGFNVNLTVLCHGELLPHRPQLQQQYPMFRWHEGSGILALETQVSYKVSPIYPRIAANQTRAEYDDLAQAQHGYLCLRLRSGQGAFGHKQYPTLLSQTLTHNARSKRQQKTLPNEPYTPVINQVVIDYRAEDDIHFATDYNELDQPATQAHSIAYHLCPMGLSTAQSNTRAGRNALFPQLVEDGNLFIAFTPGCSTQHATLYFQLAKDATHPAGEQASSVHWRYFSATGWQVLTLEHILADSTEGLLHSGLVSLALPDDAVCHPGFKLKQQYWLCVSSQQPQFFASLQWLGFDAIEVQAIDSQQKVAGVSSQWRAQKDIDGLQRVRQREVAFAGMATESEQESLVRLYERLRHKNRAVTPWDYERLIMARFANIQLAKCLPNCRFNQHQPAPGHLLLVLAPQVAETDAADPRGHYLNASTLRQVRELVQPLAPPSTIIDVVNATYEYVQVRCAVRFTDDEYQGEQSAQLQQDLSIYISPWTDCGLASAFSWSIQLKALEAYIRGLSYIEEVARLSLVKCYGDQQSPEYFRLQDTAATSGTFNRLAGSRGQSQLVASYPWSLPLPSHAHYIEMLNAGDDNYFAQPVGINSLQIGNTFVIRGSQRYAEAK